MHGTANTPLLAVIFWGKTRRDWESVANFSC
jgi:hypothetical protein